MLAECSSLPCGELFSATTDIVRDSDISAINTVPILNIAVAHRSNRSKVTGVQAWRFARIRYTASHSFRLVDCGECARVVHATMYIGPLDTGDVRRLAGGCARGRTVIRSIFRIRADGRSTCVRGSTARHLRAAGQLLPRILGCRRTARYELAVRTARTYGSSAPGFFKGQRVGHALTVA